METNRCMHTRSFRGFKSQYLKCGRSMAGKVIVLGLVILLWGPFATTATAYDDFSFLDIKVMTQNLYVGADVFAVFPGLPDQLPLRVAQLFATVQATNFPERAASSGEVTAGSDTMTKRIGLRILKNIPRRRRLK